VLDAQGVKEPAPMLAIEQAIESTQFSDWTDLRHKNWDGIHSEQLKERAASLAKENIAGAMAGFAACVLAWLLETKTVGGFLTSRVSRFFKKGSCLFPSLPSDDYRLYGLW
jgi:hypothetical protein